MNIRKRSRCFSRLSRFEKRRWEKSIPITAKALVNLASLDLRSTNTPRPSRCISKHFKSASRHLAKSILDTLKISAIWPRSIISRASLPRPSPSAGRHYNFAQELDLTAAVQSERQQLRMADELHGFLDEYLTISQAAAVPAETVYAEVLAWKGEVRPGSRLCAGCAGHRRRQTSQGPSPVWRIDSQEPRALESHGPCSGVGTRSRPSKKPRRCKRRLSDCNNSSPRSARTSTAS